MSAAGKLCIIAGGGAAPAKLVGACQRMGREFFVVCLQGQADAGFAKGLPHVWLPLGAGEKLKKLFAEHQIKEVVMIGHVRRPTLAEIKPDLWTMKVLMKIGLNSLGDDGLLKAIGKVFEEEGKVRVLAAHEIFTDMIAPSGCLTHTSPDEQAMADIQRGAEVARALGMADVGQSVVVQQGIVLGVEAIEGTDALVQRCAALKREGQGGILAKLAKPQQDNRFDLPTLGPQTVSRVAETGLRGIAFEAGRSLLVDRDVMVELADAAGIFLIGLPNGEASDG